MSKFCYQYHKIFSSLKIISISNIQKILNLKNVLRFIEVKSLSKVNNHGNVLKKTKYIYQNLKN